jgi:hypothetical protein
MRAGGAATAGASVHTVESPRSRSQLLRVVRPPVLEHVGNAPDVVHVAIRRAADDHKVCVQTQVDSIFRSRFETASSAIWSRRSCCSCLATTSSCCISFQPDAIVAV